MTNITYFPKNKEMFLKQAVEAYASWHLPEAVQYMEKALAIEKDDTLYPLYITLLLELYELDRAERFFEKTFPQIDFVETTPELDVLYIRLLIELWALDKAKLLIHHRIDRYQGNSVIVEELNGLLDKLEQQEQAYQRDKEKQIKDVLTQINHVENLSFYQQQHIIPLLNHLDDALYSQSVHTLLHSALHPILKTYLLEISIEKKVLQHFNMTWFGQTVELDVNQLSPVMDHALYQACLKYIEEVVQDEHIKEMLIKNTLLYFSILYPFPEVLFEHYDIFVRTLMKRNAHEDIEYQREWFEKIEYWIAQMEEC
ncbi:MULTISPECIES: hypothetical protein [unclassified Granulicatella]|uniref:hypothetical protein n=1 Tax=unclassified Granulicatella TaxID=2630493 RepID=UPI0010731010|nr:MULTISPECIES: hypothetical protein [unclassified Granulicatella]MBF0779699.1 hypothetical protein [Granulicatella sp. 19428wC4_WM01]TFU96221.1 hypothetical protein E4T68_01205 [Granulicatella sp. WM01]